MLAKDTLEEFKLECELRRLTPRTIKGYYTRIYFCYLIYFFLIYTPAHPTYVLFCGCPTDAHRRPPQSFEKRARSRPPSFRRNNRKTVCTVFLHVETPKQFFCSGVVCYGFTSQLSALRWRWCWPLRSGCLPGRCSGLPLRSCR